MRTFCAALLLGMAGMGWGQQVHCTTDGSTPTASSPIFDRPTLHVKADQNLRCIMIAQPKPLKCGKYEHDTNIFDDCHGDPNHPNSNIAICTHTPNCAPDMHSLTEKEWVEMNERLKKLESAVVTTSATMKTFAPKGGIYTEPVVVSSRYTQPPKRALEAKGK